jgi:HK97 family phage major capsid protein
MTLEEYKEKRKSLVDQASNLINAGNYTDSDKLMKQIEELDEKYDGQARAQANLNALNGNTTVPKDIPFGNGSTGIKTKTSNKPHGSEEYHNAFWNQVKKNASAPQDPKVFSVLNQPEVMNLSRQTEETGGLLVPEWTEKEIITKLVEASVMRQLGHVMPLRAGDNKIPIVTDYGQAAWIEENALFPDSSVALDQIKLGGHKMGRIIQVSEELLYDSVVDVEMMVVDAFVKSFGSLEEDAFITGDGVGKPTGILNRAEIGLTGTSVNAITADELHSMYYSLKRPYRAKASWLMNDQSVKIIRQLRTADGQYLWEPGFGNEPSKLLGRPVFTSPAMPLMAADSKSILFGDFSYYKIADRQGRVMQRLNEKYAEYGRVGLRMYQRVDGNLSLPEAIKVFKNKA